MNNMLPPLTRRQTEPVDLNIYPEYEGDDFTAAMKSSRQSERLRIAKENESRLKERIDTMREHRERIASDLGSRMRLTAPNTLKKLLHLDAGCGSCIELHLASRCKALIWHRIASCIWMQAPLPALASRYRPCFWHL